MERPSQLSIVAAITCMCAEVHIEICVRGADIESLSRRVLSHFSQEFVCPQSMEIHLPGKEVYRFPWSIDYLVGRMESLPLALPGEVFGSAGFTQLAECQTQFSDSRIEEII